MHAAMMGNTSAPDCRSDRVMGLCMAGLYSSVVRRLYHKELLIAASRE